MGKKLKENMSAQEALKRQNRLITLVILVPIIALVLIITVLIIVGYLTTPKPDYETFMKYANYYVESSKDVEGFKLVERDHYRIYVSDKWWNSSEKEKLKFCTNVRNSISAYAYKCKLLYGDGASAIGFFTFYDSNGIKLAQSDMADFEILH